MALKEPQSMDECIYFTRRTTHEGKGRIMAWARKMDCPKCRKAKMGKPVEDGSVKIATTPYVRKTFEGVPSYVFECGKCHKKIAITKKMKAAKKKKGKSAEEEPEADDE
ncbi:MAG: hypothetical protein NT001_04650 [Candidatus Woesearchaeota archaeon]|nr:hypothetical protein [Candidatus Woesearchaeota archaeon]